MNLKRDVSQIRDKIKFERKKNMRDTIELIEMSKLVNTVVGSVFFTNENTNEIKYKPEYTPVVSAFYKMKYYCPDELPNDDIQNFYIDWINGYYTDFLNKINPRQNVMIDNAISEKIEYVKKQVGNPLNNALASLINIVQDAIDRFSTSFGEFNVDDMKKVMAQATDFAKNMDKNSKSIVKAVTENVVEKTENDNNGTKVKPVSTKKKSNKTNTSNKSKAATMPTNNDIGGDSANGKQ